MSFDYRNDVRMRTSKALAYILRHGGPVVGLSFDDEGFASLDDALQGLYVLGRIHSTLTVTDLLAVVDDPNNPRFERRDERVRSRFGSGAPLAPPDFDGEAPSRSSPNGRQPGPILTTEARSPEMSHDASEGMSVVIVGPPSGRQRTRQTQIADAAPRMAAKSTRAPRQESGPATDVKVNTSGGFVAADRSGRARRRPDASETGIPSNQPASHRRSSPPRGSEQTSQKPSASDYPVATKIEQAGKPENRLPNNGRQRRRPRR